MLKVYNTLTRRKEEFIPLKDKQVNMYACGVTVYDDSHIGHGRSLYIFELIRRYLSFLGFKVKFVRNITDIDDKIINKAKEVAKKEKITVAEAAKEISRIYTASYYQDLQKLGIPKADYEPKATEHIPDIISFIQQLKDKGYAYQRGNDVYFRVRKFKNYGKLARKNLDELISAVRIEPNEDKEDLLDFALWKGKKDEEPSWDSPFGPGRPGWHIECSAMAAHYLGKTLDIHGGGVDLIFPHHENEIAQSEAIGNKPFSRYWLHHGLITINKQKMAKSLGNFFRLKDILAQYSADTLKIFYLSASYRSPLDFSTERIKEAQAKRKRLLAVSSYLSNVKESADITDKEILRLRDDFIAALDDDFNTPRALAVLFSLGEKVSGTPKEDFLSQVKNFYNQAKYILCLDLGVKPLNGKLRAYIEEKIRQRIKLRKEKKYHEADLIREELAGKKIILEDLANGETIWRIQE